MQGHGSCALERQFVSFKQVQCSLLRFESALIFIGLIIKFLLVPKRDLPSAGAVNYLGSAPFAAAAEKHYHRRFSTENQQKAEHFSNRGFVLSDTAEIVLFVQNESCGIYRRYTERICKIYSPLSVANQRLLTHLVLRQHHLVGLWQGQTSHLTATRSLWLQDVTQDVTIHSWTV